ncbi:hypothetical protein BGP82_12810 [Pseudomonas putida]|uniref:Uncharacterized protein n=1 Tax=Pseudomonas putida TaxID=303 RepID=A0A2S3WLG0_PSEPU|nr:hypothetical protein [Pseudomonas putida]POG02223.1 hypothetical protein BGP82_12810 [Pseudomonas putida]
MDEISIERNGVTYTAEFEVFGDTLAVFLPNGECRSTVLRGLSPEAAARPHLVSYVNGIAPTAADEER